MRWFITYYDDTGALLGGVIVTQDTEAEAYAYAETNSLEPAGGTATGVTKVADQVAPDFPLADDTTQDAAQVTTFRTTLGSPRITILPESGDLLNRRHTLPSGGVGSNATATTAYLSHDLLGAGLVGVGTEIDGGDDTIVNILEAGVYAVTSLLLSVTPSDAEALTMAVPFIDINGSQYPTEVATQAGMTEHVAMPSVTRFLNAGSTIRTGAYAEVSSGTWTLNGSGLIIQQVA